MSDEPRVRRAARYEPRATRLVIFFSCLREPPPRGRRCAITSVWYAIIRARAAARFALPMIFIEFTNMRRYYAPMIHMMSMRDDIRRPPDFAMITILASTASFHAHDTILVTILLLPCLLLFTWWCSVSDTAITRSATLLCHDGDSRFAIIRCFHYTIRHYHLPLLPLLPMPKIHYDDAPWLRYYLPLVTTLLL